MYKRQVVSRVRQTLYFRVLLRSIYYFVRSTSVFILKRLRATTKIGSTFCTKHKQYFFLKAGPFEGDLWRTGFLAEDRCIRQKLYPTPLSVNIMDVCILMFSKNETYVLEKRGI